MAIQLIDEAATQGCRVKIACIDLSITFNTYLSWKENTSDKRKGPLTEPANKLPLAVRNEIIKVATSKEFVNESPWVIVAKLADREKYLASESSFYKVLKEHSLLTHRGKERAHTHTRPTPLVATRPNQIWSWDITYIRSSVTGIYYYLYLFIDVFSRKIVGFDVFENESMENSAFLFEKLCICEGVSKHQLVLHSDNGGPMKGATMLATMQKLGVIPSFSRPSISDDNPYSEALFKTIKYHRTYPKFFEKLEDVKRWIMGFAYWYNEEHFHSGINFVTPSMRHRGIDKEILTKRNGVYLLAKEQYPERWNGRNVKKFNYEKKVYLNHLQKEKESDIEKAS